MVVGEASIHNIMGGMESTGGVRLHNHKRKLKQRYANLVVTADSSKSCVSSFPTCIYRFDAAKKRESRYLSFNFKIINSQTANLCLSLKLFCAV